MALDEHECLRWLAAARLGRVGYTRNALPAIELVSFRVHEGSLVVPARRDSELVAGTRGAVVAFEVDDYDQAARTGWSVMVVGASRPVVERIEIVACDALGWPTPAPTANSCYIAIRLTLVRGWQAMPDGIPRSRPSERR